MIFYDKISHKMEIQENINQMKEFYQSLLDYFESNGDIDECFEDLNFEMMLGNNEKFEKLLRLLSALSENHNRSNHFQEKINQTILHFKKEIKKNFSNSIIYDIFKKK